MKCDICSIVENKKSFKLIYEDELVFAILHESPAVLGHVLVIPKKHAPILEELDDNLSDQLFVVANKISSLLFEVLGAHGTNILINNGIGAGQELPHLVLNVIPRKENDSLNFEWQPKKASESELKTTQSMIRTFSDNIFSGRDNLPEIQIKQEEEVEEDYLIKGLRRVP
jgi:histidine triad (HIT) family protein